MDFKNILYINLNRRSDRKKQFLGEMRKMGLSEENIHRIEAHDKKDKPCLGCTLSHIDALEFAIEQNWDYVFVFEDDFQWNVKDRKNIDETLNSLSNLELDWDIFFLAANPRKKPIPIDNSFLRLTKSYSSSAYLIRKKYYQTLLANLKESSEMLKKKVTEQAKLDVYWIVLQEKHNWITTHKRLGKQRPGYSDIEKRRVTYRC